MVSTLGCLLFVDPPDIIRPVLGSSKGTDLCIETLWELSGFDRKSFFVFESLDALALAMKFNE